MVVVCVRSHARWRVTSLMPPRTILSGAPCGGRNSPSNSRVRPYGAFTRPVTEET